MHRMPFQERRCSVNQARYIWLWAHHKIRSVEHLETIAAQRQFSKVIAYFQHTPLAIRTRILSQLLAGEITVIEANLKSRIFAPEPDVCRITISLYHISR